MTKSFRLFQGSSKRKNGILALSTKTLFKLVNNCSLHSKPKNKFHLQPSLPQPPYIKMSHKITEKITDAKDAIIDAGAKAKVEAKHAAIDAQYNLNKAAVNTAKFVEKKATEVKHGVADVKHDLQKGYF